MNTATAENKIMYTVNAQNFSKIPGSPIAYWVSKSVFNIFSNDSISSIAFSDGQILTGDNDKYLRLLWEVTKDDIMSKKWVLHAKGGEQRRWYGNIDTVVNFSSSAIKHYKEDKISRFPQDYILFREGITWSLVSTSKQFTMRILSADTTFKKAAATILFNDKNKIKYILGYLNSIVVRTLLNIINPTLNTNIKDVLNLPYIMDENDRGLVDSLVCDNITISKEDWDSFETSWDFKKHPLI